MSNTLDNLQSGKANTGTSTPAVTPAVTTPAADTTTPKDTTTYGSEGWTLDKINDILKKCPDKIIVIGKFLFVTIFIKWRIIFLVN